MVQLYCSGNDDHTLLTGHSLQPHPQAFAFSMGIPYISKAVLYLSRRKHSYCHLQVQYPTHLPSCSSPVLQIECFTNSHSPGHANYCIYRLCVYSQLLFFRFHTQRTQGLQNGYSCKYRYWSRGRTPTHGPRISFYD